MKFPLGTSLGPYQVEKEDINQKLIQYAEVTISSAQIRALRATPITLVAAPGAGYFLQYLASTHLYDYGGTAYTIADPGDDMKIKYNNSAGTAVAGVIAADGFIDQVVDMVSTAVGIIALDTAANLDNAKLVIHNVGGAEYADGTGVLRIKVSYIVWPTGF